MSQFIQDIFERRKEKAALVPINVLQRLREDFSHLQMENELNAYQHFIIDEMHSLELPSTDFEIQSVLITAIPYIARARVNFHYKKDIFPVDLPATYINYYPMEDRIDQYLQREFESSEYHIVNAPVLPKKLLAVRSGLAKYGRNNITYVEGMGSFVGLSTFFTDIPCDNIAWCEIEQMDLCKNCKACIRACPTQAILPDRFLINNERCLTCFNESDEAECFPEWMETNIHHTLCGCMYCQINCPINLPFKDGVYEMGDFSEDETEMLLSGMKFEDMPDDLQEKVDSWDFKYYLTIIPRNLRILLANAGSFVD